jgi:hypothetical protein
MEIVEREVRRHHFMVSDAKKLIYASNYHQKGVEAYRDKKRIYELELKLKERRQLLSISDLQFLQTIHEKY